MGSSARMYRIVSDGTSLGTEIHDPDGKPMGYIQSLEISITVAKQLVEVTRIDATDIATLPPTPFPAELDVSVPEEHVNFTTVPLDPNK